MSRDAVPNNLAIETSSRAGSITLGCDDELLRTLDLSQHRRHNLELLPAISEHCDPKQLREVYLNIGPGSFTGLRIAVTTAKMLAATLNVRIIALEAVDVIAAQITGHENFAVCVNTKRDTVYARLYTDGKPINEASVTTINDLLAAAPRPLAIVGHPLPEFEPPQGVTVLAKTDAQAHSETVWRLGRQAAARHQWADPATILPRYARAPEAVELWQQRHGQTKP